MRLRSGRRAERDAGAFRSVPAPASRHVIHGGSQAKNHMLP